MAESNRYIGITIGPIFRTMNLVSTPAALWVSSYIFSSINRYICEELIKKGVKEEQIISPYFKTNDEFVNEKNRSGIGLYHDRVIFRADNFKISDINEIRSKVIDKVCDDFGFTDIKDKEYIRKYILIAAAEFYSKSGQPFLTGGKILDSLELSCPLVTKEDKNPILEKFSGGDSRKNEEIKKIARENMNIDSGQWQLLSGDKIRSLEDIAGIAGSGSTERKISKYYAIVRSDGDNMSRIISSLMSDKECTAYSLACFKFCAEISELVGSYGGVTIYAGGDDLLALLPCEDKSGRTLFNFAKNANDVFAKSFGEYIEKITQSNSKIQEKADKIPLPSLSMGIFISYYKYPLYEALEKSAELLFEKAKSEKDCIAVQLSKHSGQSAEILIKNNDLDALLKLQNSILKGKNPLSQDKFLLSSMHKLEAYKSLFKYADSSSSGFDKTIDNLFANIYDAEDQKKYKPDIEAVRDYYKSVNCSDEKRTEAVSAALCILKLFTEKKGEN